MVPHFTNAQSTCEPEFDVGIGSIQQL